MLSITVYVKKEEDRFQLETDVVTDRKYKAGQLIDMAAAGAVSAMDRIHQDLVENGVTVERDDVMQELIDRMMQLYSDGKLTVEDVTPQ